MTDSPEQPATFKRGQRVLYRRSVLCNRAPEYGRIVRRHKDEMDGNWYVVRDEEPHPGYSGVHYSKISEHASMLEAVS